MIKERLSRLSEGLATKWRHNTFSVAQAKLTAAYAVTTTILLGVFSYALYSSLLGELQALIEDQINDSDTQRIVLDGAAGILQMRILIADGIVLAVVIIIGYILTKMTLKPIQRALDRERRFIADAAHELRTPLAIMKTEMEVALRDKGLATESANKVLVSAVEEIDNLTQIANGLIEIVRGQTKKANMTNIPLRELVKNVIGKLSPLAQLNNIELIENLNNSEPIVKGNYAALSGAVYNVLHNALLYTSAHGAVTISLATKKSKCELIIADTGVGIAPKDIQHVFEPFYRSDASHATSGGAGLGLAIVKTTVEQHSGNITIESTIGKGTAVHIVLPTV